MVADFILVNQGALGFGWGDLHANQNNIHARSELFSLGPSSREILPDT